MPQATGRSAELRIGFESTFGETPGSPATFKVPFSKLNIGEKQNQNESSVMTGSRNPQKPFRGFKSVDGSVSVPLDTVAFGYWLKALFGSPTTTGTGPYTHEYKIGSSVPSLFTEKAHTDLTLFYLFNGVKANGFSVSFGGDSELLADVQLVGKKETKGTSEVATATDKTDGANFEPFEATLSGATSVKNVSLNYTNNLDTDQYTLDNGAEVGDIPEGMAGVSGSFTALFEDDSLLAAARDQTEMSLTVTVSDGTNSIAFAINELELEPTDVPIDTPKGLTQSFNFKAYHDDHAANSAIVITVINGQDIY